MSEQRRPVPQDLLRIHPVGEPRFSPDGRTLAYVVQEFDRQQDTVISDIWVVQVPDGSPHRITAGAARKFSPRWSPDGSKVAFLSEEQAKPGIWLVSAGGGEAQRIATQQQPTGGLSWSPDGRCLAYAAQVFSYADSWAPYPGAPENDAARARGQARGDDSAGDVKVISRLEHKRDGVGYFGDAFSQIFVVAADTGATSRQVTTGPYDHTDPAWSPNGDLLVCVARREAETPGRDSLWGAKDLWQVKTDGSSLTRIFAGHGPIQAPAFSPDGQAIAFFGHTAEFGPATFPQLWLFQCNTGKVTCLTDSLDRFVGTPAYADSRYNLGMSPLTPIWSADGSELYFLAGMGGDAHLFAVAAANGTIRQISPGEGRSIADVTVNSHGGAGYVRGDSGALDELYYLSPDRADERQVTNHNAEATTAVGFQKGERVTFTGADGWPIEGWLYTPPGRAKDERVPFVLIVHGGPHLCFGEILSLEVQGLLGAGIAVMTVNPRGSGGYSQAFSAACLQDWGGKDREDLMAGVDYAIARGVADPERLGIMGWSYGGFMSSWTITQTDRFKAALIGACVSNRLSFAGTSDVPWFMTHSAGGESWEPAGVEKLLERSAIRYVKNINTPALIVHPEGDLRCPVEQGEQLFTNLRRLGKEAYLVKYPGEFHIMVKPSHRLDYCERIVSWFRHRL